MLKLNVESFITALSALNAYVPPTEDREGVRYLYEKLYKPLLEGARMRIRDIDFNAFALEDVEKLEYYFDKTLRRNESAARQMRERLWNLTPVVSKTKFI